MADDSTNIFDDIVSDASAIESGDTVELLDENILDAEIAKDVKYGDSALEAAAGSALSAATLGLSDQALVNTFGVSPERLRETRERSSIAAGAGTALGVIGPALVSGGTSALAKGVSAPLRATEAAGALTAQSLEKLVSGKIRSQAAKEIVKKATAIGTEGAIYGVGNVISESALGRADLNAENLVAGAGAGALLGGLMGGAYGGAKATVPLAKKGIAPLTNKLASGAKNIVDPELAASELIGLTPAKALKEAKYHPTFQQDLPDYLVNKLDLGVLQTAEDRLAKNTLVKEQAGKQIGNIIETLESTGQVLPETLPSRVEVATKLQSRLDDFAAKFEAAPGSAKAELDVLKAFQKDLNKLVGHADAGPVGLLELDNLRKTYAGIKFKGGGAAESFKANVANTLRSELRGIVDDTANKIASNSADEAVAKMAADLKSANKTYSMASTVEKYLPKKINQSSAVSLSDVVKGTAIGAMAGSTPLGAAAIGLKQLLKSDARRAAAVLADIQAQTTSFNNALKSSVNNFVSKAKKPTKQLSLRTLINSGYAVNYETREAPKSKQEAFTNTAKNLEALANDEQLMVDHLAKSTARIAQAAPEISNQTHTVLINATKFLENKLPKDPSQPNVFAREYQPSSMEIAKFERYMQAVEHPLSVFDDMERGTLTREHVEALKAVYPAMYEQLRQEIIDKVTTEDEKIPYNKKVQLGILLDVPTDLSLEPTNIAGLQANFMPQNDPMQVEAQQGAFRMGSQTGLQNLNSAARMQTETQKVANRS
jgi:hypothetical protein